MGGFLHQLASRSLGLAPQIRPRAALPYAPPAADLPMTGTASHESPPIAAIEPSGLAPTTARRGEPAADPALPAPVVGKTAPASRRAADTPTPAASQPPRMAQPEGVPPAIAPDLSAPSTARPAVAGPATVEQLPVPPRPEPAPAAVRPAESRQPAAADLDKLIARLLGEHPRTPDKSPPPPPPPTAIVTHQPVQRPTAIIPTRPPAGRERQAAAPETDSAPEVHITIGRLEVNPPSRPAPAAQPARPRGPAPLSLSDYLARRNGGRP